MNSQLDYGPHTLYKDDDGLYTLEKPFSAWQWVIAIAFLAFFLVGLGFAGTADVQTIRELRAHDHESHSTPFYPAYRYR
jgi:hypothetical protein